MWPRGRSAARGGRPLRRTLGHCLKRVCKGQLMSSGTRRVSSPGYRRRGERDARSARTKLSGRRGAREDSKTPRGLGLRGARECLAAWALIVTSDHLIRPIYSSPTYHEREAVALDSMRTEWGNRSVYRIDVGYRFSRGRLPFCISSEDEVLGLPLQTYKHGMLSRHVLNWPQVGKCFNALT